MVIMLLGISYFNFFHLKMESDPNVQFLQRGGVLADDTWFFHDSLIMITRMAVQFYIGLYIYCLTEPSLCFRSENKHGQHTFDIPTVANDMGVTPFELTNQLYDLKVWISG